jgi:hypothetical protein
MFYDDDQGLRAVCRAVAVIGGQGMLRETPLQRLTRAETNFYIIASVRHGRPVLAAIVAVLDALADVMDPHRVQPYPAGAPLVEQLTALHEQVTRMAAGGGEWPDVPTLATVQRVVTGILAVLIRDDNGNA